MSLNLEGLNITNRINYATTRFKQKPENPNLNSPLERSPKTDELRVRKKAAIGLLAGACALGGLFGGAIQAIMQNNSQLKEYDYTTMQGVMNPPEVERSKQRHEIATIYRDEEGKDVYFALKKDFPGTISDFEKLFDIKSGSIDEYNENITRVYTTESGEDPNGSEYTTDYHVMRVGDVYKVTADCIWPTELPYDGGMEAIGPDESAVFVSSEFWEPDEEEDDKRMYPGMQTAE